MSGFALVFNPNEPISTQDALFTNFLTEVVAYKYLPLPNKLIVETHCLAAKLDTASSLHSGVIQDKITGSWLMAAGSVVDTAHIHPQGNLQRLLNDYLAQGLGVFNRLDGQFALLIYDRRQDNLILVSDALGYISVFWGQIDQRYFISTSALATARAIQSQPDELMLRSFILYGSILPGENTFWQGVKRVPPATIVRFGRNQVKQERYWSFQFDPQIYQLSAPQAVEVVIDTLSGLIQRDLTREGQVWLSLTGGFDSRVLAVIAHHAGLVFKSYCHGQPDSLDVRIAAAISQKMNWPHHYFALPKDWGHQRSYWLSRTLTQGDAHLGVLKYSRIVREQTLKSEQYPVSLWGYGGETYRGYYWKQEFLNIGRTSKVDYDKLLAYRIISTDFPVLADHTVWLKTIRGELKTRLITVGEQYPDWPNTVKLDVISKFLEIASSGMNISAMMGMQRIVTPFDFKEGLNCVLSINYKWRTQEKLFRLILERLNRPLADMETADGGPAAPLRLTNVHKFIPYWLNIGEKLLWGVSRKFLGRRLWQKQDAGPMGTAYPLHLWLQETLTELEEKNWLVPSEMYSAPLYNAERLQMLLNQTQLDAFHYEGLLGRILTVEMALRQVGTSL